MRWWFVLTLVACGNSRAKPDAPTPADGAVDTAVAVDAPPDMAIDAPPDAPDHDPACTSTPAILVDTSPRHLTNMAEVGDVLYVDAVNPNNGSDAVVMMVDPGTGVAVASPLVVGAGAAVWPAPDAAYAAEIRANGSIWRLVPGQAPVELVTGRASPYVVTSDGTYVYWNESDVISRRLITGGAIQQVMSGCTNPAKLVVDATDLYCLQFMDGSVRHGPKDGSAAATGIAGSDGYPSIALVQDATTLYYASFYNNPRLLAALKPDGPFALVTQSPDLGRYLGLALAPNHYYLTNQEGYVEQIDRATHAVHKIQILDSVNYGSPSLDPIVWHDQLLVATEAYTTAGTRYVLHCVN